MRGSELGTIVKLPDGRVGTTVFKGLCGVGIVWGEHDPDPADFKNSFGDIGEPSPEVARRLEEWRPQALLRNASDWRDGRTHLDGMELVGDDFKIIRYGLTEWEE